MERTNPYETIDYKIEESSKIPGRMILRLGVSNYGYDGGMLMVEVVRQWYQPVNHLDNIDYVDQYVETILIRRSIESKNNYMIIKSYHSVGDSKTKDEIMWHLFYDLVIKPAYEENQFGTSDNKFGWFKQYLPEMARRHFDMIEDSKRRIVEEVINR